MTGVITLTLKKVVLCSVLCYRLLSSGRQHPWKASYPGIATQSRAIAKVGAAAEKISISSALQRAEHDKRFLQAEAPRTSYVLIFAAGDIQEEQHAVIAGSHPLPRPLNSFCKILTELCKVIVSACNPPLI